MQNQPRNLAVSDVALPLDRVPVVAPTTLFKAALEAMGRSRLGIVCVVDAAGTLRGIVTDGDIRRQLLRMQKPFSAFFGDDVIEHAITSPTTVPPGMALLEAVDLMEEKQVWDLPVVDSDGKLVGMLHLHPVVKLLIDGQG
jgi:DeoR family transcriptional regulator, catabolite repression regulator